MTLSNKVVPVFAIMAAVHLAACGVNSHSEANQVTLKTADKTVTKVEAVAADKKSVQPREYVKPGAPVELSHDFKGFIDAGSYGSVNLGFKTSPSVVSMTVKVSADGGINVTKSAQPSAFSMKRQSVQDMAVPFSAKTHGRHYLNVQVTTLDTAGQKMARAFTIPVQVGDPRFNQSKPANPNLQITPSGEAIIAMDAEETRSQ